MQGAQLAAPISARQPREEMDISRQSSSTITSFEIMASDRAAMSFALEMMFSLDSTSAAGASEFRSQHSIMAFERILATKLKDMQRRRPGRLRRRKRFPLEDHFQQEPRRSSQQLRQAFHDAFEEGSDRGTAALEPRAPKLRKQVLIPAIYSNGSSSGAARRCSKHSIMPLEAYVMQGRSMGRCSEAQAGRAKHVL